MKKKWTEVIWRIICFSGIPWLFIFSMLGILVKKWYCIQKDIFFTINSLDDLKGIIALAACGWLFVLLKNSMWAGSGKKIDLLTWTEKYKYIPPEESGRKKKAQYPGISEEYLSSRPDQLPLGVDPKTGKFVQFNLSEYLSFLLFGSPGAGKTTLLLTFLIYQLHKRPRDPISAPAMFVFDFKEAELYRKSSMPDDDRIEFVSLSGRKDWGWDPYYRLAKDSTDDEVIQELTLIADIIIDTSNEKNAFFSGSAKIIIIFIGLFDFRRGKSFIQTIDHITTGDVKSMLQEVWNYVCDRPEYKKIKDAIAEYVAVEGQNEALDNIKMTLKLNMSVFKVEDVRWALEYNPQKASPYDLEEGKNIFFYPGDTAVTDVLLKIIAKQLEYHCRHRDFMNIRSDDELRQIIVVADECFTIGKVIDWGAWCSVARGFKTSIIQIWQAYSQIVDTYNNENRAKSIMDDVAGIAVLAVNSPQNAEIFVDFAGEYLESKDSTNYGGKTDGNHSKSYDYRPILTKKDFLQLRKKEEIIMLIDGEYIRTKSEAARYYMIPEFKKISEKCLEAHKNYMK